MEKFKKGLSSLSEFKALSRDEMKAILGGYEEVAPPENPKCSETCQQGPVVDKYKCASNCSICYKVSESTGHICVTSIS